jgi:hypothetical protein
MLRWSWVLSASLVVGVFGGCAGKAKRGSPEPSASAGRSPAGSGGTGAEAGEGGAGADAARAGTAGGGTGGSLVGGGGRGGGTGGAAGAGLTSGSAGQVAGAGRGGQASLGGGAGAGGSAAAAPEGWTCQAAKYADGKSCDCGCGALDPDCETKDIASCDVCNVLGGCAHGPCPSDIDPEDNSRCALPTTWACNPSSYGDGVCDCGCGAQDVDCKSTQPEDCDACPATGCAADTSCSGLDPKDNTVCTSPPSRWKCDPSAYRDGSRCDCGCGFLDPDCSGHGVDACDKCDESGSCSRQGCPGNISPSANDSCNKVPPADWTCGAWQYADQTTCDCGCGAPDPDCATDNPRECEVCACGHCPESVDPADPSQCASPPAGWTCPAEDYASGSCHCGCGVMDPACIPDHYCQKCDDGCSHGHCELIDQDDITQCTFVVPSNWTCPRDSYGDGVCDCGCGADDPICAGITKSSCDSCTTQGSCSKLPCDDPDNQINTTNNAACLPP